MMVEFAQGSRRYFVGDVEVGLWHSRQLMSIKITTRGAGSRIFIAFCTHSSNYRSPRVNCQTASLSLMRANEGLKNLW